MTQSIVDAVVLKFADNGSKSALCVHIGIQPATLHHKSGDYAVENNAVVRLLIY